MNLKKVLLAVCLVSVLLDSALSKKSKDKSGKEGKKDGSGKGKDKDIGIDHVVTEEVYLDMEIMDYYGKGDHESGRIVIGIFGDVVPMTALNFISLAKGFRKRGILYKYAGTRIHRVVQDFMIQGGDVTHTDGHGGMSLYGALFDDENYDVSHQATGIVSMANYGKNSNASQFFILLQKARWLDRRHVAFGKVLKGMNFLRKLGGIKSSPKGTMYYKVKIMDSGVLGIPSKYQLTQEQMNSEEDIE